MLDALRENNEADEELIDRLIVEAWDRRNQPGDFIPSIEAARILNISVSTLNKKASERLVPYYKYGKTRQFSKRELLNLIREGRKSTRSELEITAVEHMARYM